MLVEGWAALDADSRVFRWLARRGFPTALARKLIDIYGQLDMPEGAEADAALKGRVVWHLGDDPYRMLAFAPWAQVDAAALRMGAPYDDPRRLMGAVEAVLAERLKEHDTWVSPALLRAETGRLLGASRDTAAGAIERALDGGVIVRHAGGYQGPGSYIMERFVDWTVAEMVQGRFLADQGRLRREVTRDEVESIVHEFERSEGYSLSVEQRAAVWMASTEPLSIIVGGPGVGKTTVLKAIHGVGEAFDHCIHQIALSGRAAQRMAEATGRPASTIAAFMLRVEKGEVKLNDEPLVIVDESSMVELATLYRLLRGFEPGVRLLLVGDPGQLPPIGFGLTFHVIASDDRIARTMLTLVQRQTQESGIPAVCGAIREGTVPEIGTFSGKGRGVCFIEVGPEQVSDTVIDVVQRLGGIDQVQVIGAVKGRAGGISEINGRLHAIMAIGRRGCGARFSEGEPIIAMRNDYDVGVMNGELGIVLNSDGKGGLQCRFDSGNKHIPGCYLPHLELAYGITCHKAQGSQFSRVIVVVTKSRILDRALLLTAVSRAREQVILIGDRNTFEAAVIAPPSPWRRNVGLGREEHLVIHSGRP